METPGARRSTRRKSQFPEDEGDESSSQAESATGRSVSGRSLRRNVGSSEKTATNGHSANGNGTSKASSNGTSKKANGTHKEVIDGWEVGTDPKIDRSGHVDFGGSFGVGAMMIGFPLLMYYMWIGATFYNGKFPTPTKGQTTAEFFQHLAGLVSEFAFPSVRAWIIYWVFFIFEEAATACFLELRSWASPLPMRAASS